MPTTCRRRIIRRVCLLTAATAFLLLWYVLAAPFVVFIVAAKFPAAKPVIEALYRPLIYIYRDTDAPGLALYANYVDFCIRLM